MNNKKEDFKVYFENLNAIRFIAVFLVIIHHIEQLKSIFRIPNAFGNPFVQIKGKLFFNRLLTNKFKRLIFSKISQLFILIITLILMFKGFSLPFFRNEFYSVLFGLIICNLAVNENRLFSLENKLTNYLGKISYGLYMFHPFCIIKTIRLSQYFNAQNNYFVYPVVYVLTVIIASVSYEFFEKIFIDKKIQYSDIISGDHAKKR